MRRLLLLPALALVLVGTPVLALQQPSGGSADATATPAVTEVPLPAAQSTTVEPGFEQQVAVDASVVGVTWDGDPNAEFSVETRDASGRWQPAVAVEADDTSPDAGSPDASSSAAARQATEPIWVKDATAVRVRLEDGTASNVKISAVDSTPETPQPAATTAPAAPPATSTTSEPVPSTAAPSTTTTPSTTPSTTAPAGDGSQVAPPGSAGATTGWLVPVDGPARYAYAGALLAAALLLGAIAFGWSPWRRRGVRRVALLVVAAGVLVTACRPVAAPPPPPATNGGTQPGIVMRSTWGAASPSCTDYTSSMVFAVVHHTVNSNNYSAAESPQILRSIQAYHMNTLGYCDIAYNFLIDKYGQVFEGRGGGIDRAVLGAHTGGFNSKSTGVALIGDYRTATISPAQWNALVHLLQWKLSIHGSDAMSPFTTTSNGGGSRYPAGQSVTFPSRILGHTDLWPTACPGANVMGQLPMLRQQVQGGIVAPPTTTTTTSTPPTT